MTLAITAALLLRDSPATSLRSRDAVVLWLLWLALFGWLVWINRSDQRMLGQDVLLLPGIAQVLPRQPWLPSAFTATEPGRAYPPGLVILFSPFTLFLSGVQQLWMWALATQAVLAALPVLWACALRRWFRLPLGRLPFALILAAAMLCLERTAVLGGSIKNVQHAALGVILPTVLLLLPRKPGRRQALLATLLLAALAASYYTALHLFVAVIVGWALSDLCVRRRLSLRTARLVALLAVATILVIVSLLGFVSSFRGDPRLPASELAIGSSLQRIFVDPRERFWFIFGPGTSEVFGSRVRRAALLASIVASASLPFITRRLRPGWRRAIGRLLSVARLSVAMGIACLVLAGMAALGPVTRLSFDYARWLVWVPQIVVLAAPFLSFTVVLQALGQRRVVASVSSVAVIVVLYGSAHRYDVARVRQRGELAGVSLRSIELLAERLGSDSPCLVIAPSKPIVARMLYVGVHPLSDVVDVVSPCRSTGGSFLRNPIPGGRTAGGLPAGNVLADWPREYALWAIGGSSLVAALDARQRALTWRRSETFAEDDVDLWRASRSASEGGN